MAKKLNTSEFVLEENEHFNYISVNLNQSTVHVPTNVYEQCKHYRFSSYPSTVGPLVYVAELDMGPFC